MSLKIVTNSPQESEEVGYKIGTLATEGLVLTLAGDLGAGKTLLTKGIARGLGVPRPEYVSSPTFTIHKVYQGRLTLNHLDLYRLGEESEIDGLGLDDTLGVQGVSVIEWPDRFYAMLGKDRLDARICIVDDFTREITFEWLGPTATSVGGRLIHLIAGSGR